MPNLASPHFDHLAQCLLAHEAPAVDIASRMPLRAKWVCAKLQNPLSEVLGRDGFRFLLSRALALASADFPALRSARVEADGSLTGGDEIASHLDLSAAAQHEIALVGQVLGLLVTFIGSALTRQLLQDCWPQQGYLYLLPEKNRDEKSISARPRLSALSLSMG